MSEDKTIPRIALTPGEPAGIGPDLCVKLAQQAWPVELIAIADENLLQKAAKRLSLPLSIRFYSPQEPAQEQKAGSITVLPVSLAEEVTPGKLNEANVKYVLQCLNTAIGGCIAHDFDAMVTGPVHKGIINDAGEKFSGHTEYIAERAHSNPVMMLATEGLRVALATTHLPLQEVPAAITMLRLRQVLETLHRDLQLRFGIEDPRILVCGLNPHAGEGGHLGLQEQEIIAPLIKEYRAWDWKIEGPVPADTAFTQDNLKNFDVVLAMYHDQGLPVIKHMGFGKIVNITLGMPIIRTSVDHGTALELAGTGKADPTSLIYALKCAIELIERRE